MPPGGSVVPAWRVEDLQLLARACSVPEEKLHAMDQLPALKIDHVDE